MERKIRKFKRLSEPSEEYGKRFKQQMDILNYHVKRFNPIESEIRCEIIKRKPITKELKKFPKEIRYKIYIFSMKRFWKDKMEEQSLKPMWCDYKKYVDNEMKKCIIDNIHFMHLDFNTLPENKKWIPGCQCNYCINYHKYKINEYETIIEDESEFLKIIHCNDTFINFWNKYLHYNVVSNHEEIMELIGFNGIGCPIRIFDPLKGYLRTVYDQIKMNPNDSPIYFSNEVEEIVD